jgi:hypothetical protein
MSQSQKEMIVAYMKEHGSITPLEAQRELGCMRLGARIWDLIHKDGLNIVTESVAVKNRFGKDTVVARYRLGE